MLLDLTIDFDTDRLVAYKDLKKGTIFATGTGAVYIKVSARMATRLNGPATQQGLYMAPFEVCHIPKPPITC